jgi:hypothetical protein
MPSLESAVAGVSEPLLPLAVVADRAAILAEAARAEATRRAYRSDWAHFEGWCLGHGLEALPAAPETVGLYLTAHEASLSIATLTRRLSTIATAHRLAGHRLDSGIRRSATSCGASGAPRASPRGMPRPSPRPSSAGPSRPVATR